MSTETTTNTGVTRGTITQDVAKQTDISDSLNLFRYRVILRPSSTLSPYTYDVTSNYTVEVVNFVRNTPLVIYHKEFNTYSEAQTDYDRNIQNYRIFINTQTTPLDDINLYKAKINYQVVAPNCCMTCKFCHRSNNGKFLECHNEENFSFMNAFSDNGSTAFTPNGLSSIFNVYPKVETLGKCDNFERGLSSTSPDPLLGLSEDVRKLIVDTIDSKFDALELQEIPVECGSST